MKKLLKIAMIGQKGLPDVVGGVERHVQELSVRLVRFGFDVTVYTRPHYSDPRMTQYHGVELISLPSIHTKHLDAISHSFLSLFHAMTHGADVIHFQGIGPSLLSFIPRIFTPWKTVITTFHSIDRYQKKWSRFAQVVLYLAEWTSVVFAHETFVVSPEIQTYVQEKYHRKTTYLPNGISDVEAAPARLILSQFDLTPNGYVLAVSRLVRHKGLHYLIAAFQKWETSMKLVIVGEGAFTDDYVRELEELAKNDPRIVFTGAQRGGVLNELYQNAGIFVHPSEAEGLSITLLEAMAAGCPILASDIPSHQRLLGDERGWNFTARSVSDLTRKLQDVGTLSLALRKSRGRRAQAWILKHYHWDEIAQKTSAVISAVVSARRLPARRWHLSLKRIGS